MDNQELAEYRRFGVGMIFQSFNLISSLSALENVGLQSCPAMRVDPVVALRHD